MKKLVAAGLIAVLGAISGCATSFTGSAKVDGPRECRKVCDTWGMDLAGMVAMGEYTNGCICKIKGEQVSVNGIGATLLMSSVGGSGGAAGVYKMNQED